MLNESSAKAFVPLLAMNAFALRANHESMCIIEMVWFEAMLHVRLHCLSSCTCGIKLFTRMPQFALSLCIIHTCLNPIVC